MFFHYIRVDTTYPRSKDDTLPDRISSVRNVGTPMESTKVVGHSQERRKPPVGIGGTKKRKLPAERQREYITGQIGFMPEPKGC